MGYGYEAAKNKSKKYNLIYVKVSMKMISYYRESKLQKVKETPVIRYAL